MSDNRQYSRIRRSARAAALGALVYFGCAGFQAAEASLPLGGNVIRYTNFYARPTGGFWMDDRYFWALNGAPNIGFDNGGGFILPHGEFGAWIVGVNGTLTRLGDAQRLCEGLLQNCSGFQIADGGVTAVAPTLTFSGFWIALDDGSILTGGCAPFLGSTGGRGNDKVLVNPVTDLRAMPGGRSYGWIWEDGRIELSRVQGDTYGTQGGDDRNARDGSCLQATDSPTDPDHERPF